MARNSALHLLGYSPPQLHTGKVWFISYYILHPDTGEPLRKRVKVNRVGGVTARRQYAQRLMAELQSRLHAGWRPHIEDDAPKAHHTLEQAISAYLRFKEQDLRHSSPAAYQSHARILSAWAACNDLLKKYVPAFQKRHAVAFMDHAREERGIQARTWNNYRDMQAGMWKWFIEQGYCNANPFAGIKGRKEPPKVRRYLSRAERDRFAAWCEANEPEFFTACLFVYHTLLRPRELMRLQVRHVDPARGVLLLPGTITKNAQEAVTAIPDVMLPWVHRLQLHRHDPDHYVMGVGFQPGPKPVPRNAYSRKWAELRKALGWGRELQLYSLRDTGIIALLQSGMDVLAVKQQARHKNIETTNAYLRHAFPEGVEAIRKGAEPLRTSAFQEKDNQQKAPQ